MPESIRRTKGRAQSYKFDRGGTPADPGPFVGVVKNNVDPARMGRLQVYIEQFAGGNESDDSLWRTVSYLPPFYGSTFVPGGAPTGPGTFLTNQQSYGMWFTPPDLGVSVICFFVEGDPNQGYYVGVIPDEGINHMIPAIGAARRYQLSPEQQEALPGLASAELLPVTEINTSNDGITLDPRFFDKIKPVHTYLAAILYQQGLINDTVRGPITSSSQRESPSSVYGVSTPGRPIFQGGATDRDIKRQLETEQIRPQDIVVVGRRGGHSIVMDDGDLTGRDNLVRIRTAKGHQITMSDEADCFYIIHANGQTWIEFGTEGTVDVYSTNSVNIRTQGEINLHADKNININAGENFFIRAKNFKVESQESTQFMATKDFTIYSQDKIAVKADGSLALDSKTAGWLSSGAMKLKGSRIDLNGPAPEPVQALKPITEYELDDTKFQTGEGWIVEQGKLKTIVPRAPTHEPWPYHNKGVPVQVDLGASQGSPPGPGVASALGRSASSPITAPINTASLLNTPAASSGLGSLNKQQVTGLLASAQTAVAQPSNVISVDKGIGQYGFSPAQLESAGLLKPGTVSQLTSIQAGTPTSADIAEAARLGPGFTAEQVARQREVNQILASPQVWTGQDGVNNITSLLNDPKLQDKVQQNLMTSALTGLQNSGIATGNEAANTLAPLIQGATKFGVGPVSSLIQGTAPPNLTTALNNTFKNASFATSFTTDKLGDFSSLVKKATAAVATVNRAIVDTALVASLGDPKIPAPLFKPLPRPEFTPSQFEGIRTDFETKADEAALFVEQTRQQLDQLYSDALALQGQETIPSGSVNALDSRLNSIRTSFNGRADGLLAPLRGLRDSAPADVKAEFESRYEGIARLIEIVRGFVQAIREIIAELRQRQT